MAKDCSIVSLTTQGGMSQSVKCLTRNR